MANKSLGWIVIGVLGIVVYIARGQGIGPFSNNQLISNTSQNSSSPQASQTETTGEAGNTMEDLQNLAITFYINNFDQNANAQSLEAVVQNYGCHVEVHVYQDENLMRRLRWLYEFNANSFE